MSLNGDLGISNDALLIARAKVNTLVITLEIKYHRNHSQDNFHNPSTKNLACYPMRYGIT
jgi:hypothetical protein